LLEDFGFNGDEPREDSTAGTKREYMVMKKDGIVFDEVYARRRTFCRVSSKDVRESVDEGK